MSLGTCGVFFYCLTLYRPNAYVVKKEIDRLSMMNVIVTYIPRTHYLLGQTVGTEKIRKPLLFVNL